MDRETDASHARIRCMANLIAYALSCCVVSMYMSTLRMSGRSAWCVRTIPAVHSCIVLRSCTVRVLVRCSAHHPHTAKHGSEGTDRMRRRNTYKHVKRALVPASSCPYACDAACGTRACGLVPVACACYLYLVCFSPYTTQLDRTMSCHNTCTWTAHSHVNMENEGGGDLERATHVHDRDMYGMHMQVITRSAAASAHSPNAHRSPILHAPLRFLTPHTHPSTSRGITLMSSASRTCDVSSLYASPHIPVSHSSVLYSTCNSMSNM